MALVQSYACNTNEVVKQSKRMNDAGSCSSLNSCHQYEYDMSNYDTYPRRRLKCLLTVTLSSPSSTCKFEQSNNGAAHRNSYNARALCINTATVPLNHCCQLVATWSYFFESTPPTYPLFGNGKRANGTFSCCGQRKHCNSFK